MMSKLYSALLIMGSLFAMAALGIVILIAVIDIVHLAAPTNRYYGMNR